MGAHLEKKDFFFSDREKQAVRSWNMPLMPEAITKKSRNTIYLGFSSFEKTIYSTFGISKISKMV